MMVDLFKATDERCKVLGVTNYMRTADISNLWHGLLGFDKTLSNILMQSNHRFVNSASTNFPINNTTVYPPWTYETLLQYAITNTDFTHSLTNPTIWHSASDLYERRTVITNLVVTQQVSAWENAAYWQNTVGSYNRWKVNRDEFGTETTSFYYSANSPAAISSQYEPTNTLRFTLERTMQALKYSSGDGSDTSRTAAIWMPPPRQTTHYEVRFGTEYEPFTPYFFLGYSCYSNWLDQTSFTLDKQRTDVVSPTIPNLQIWKTFSLTNMSGITREIVGNITSNLTISTNLPTASICVTNLPCLGSWFPGEERIAPDFTSPNIWGGFYGGSLTSLGPGYGCVLGGPPYSVPDAWLIQLWEAKGFEAIAEPVVVIDWKLRYK
jgi:hypothetical protein